MATDAEKRAWLRANTDQDVPARGRLRPELLRIYDAAHQADGDPDWDLEDGPGETLTPDDLEPDVPMDAERQPRTPKSQRAQRRASQTASARAGSLAGKLLGTKPKDAKPGARKKAPPRISLEKFTTRCYTSLGRMVRPLSVPMSNCLQAQAAMAGVLLEDMVAHTMADKVLQPLARAEDKLDKGVALVAPPLLVLAIEQSMQLPADQMMARQMFLMPMLRESLRVGIEVSGQYADRIKARLEENAEMEKKVDELIALIFAQPQAKAEAPEPEMAGTAA